MLASEIGNNQCLVHAALPSVDDVDVGPASAALHVVVGLAVTDFPWQTVLVEPCCKSVQFGGGVDVCARAETVF